MTENPNDRELDERLRAADPLTPGSLPSQTDTDAALRRFLASDPDAGRRRPAPRPRGRARPRIVAWTTGAIVAAGTAVALLLGAATSSPAFAVARNSDGTVTVKLFRVSGVPGANDRLAKLGVRAQIVALRTAVAVARLHPCGAKGISSVTTLTIDPGSIPPRQVLLLGADKAARLGFYTTNREVRAARAGQVPPPALAAAEVIRRAGVLAADGTGTTGSGTDTTGSATATTADGTGTRTTGSVTATTGRTGAAGSGAGAPGVEVLPLAPITAGPRTVRVYCGAPILVHTGGAGTTGTGTTSDTGTATTP